MDRATQLIYDPDQLTLFEAAKLSDIKAVIDAELAFSVSCHKLKNVESKTLKIEHPNKACRLVFLAAMMKGSDDNIAGCITFKRLPNGNLLIERIDTMLLSSTIPSRSIDSYILKLMLDKEEIKDDL